MSADKRNYGARGVQRARLTQAAEKEVAETAQRAQVALAGQKAAEATLKKANNEQNKAAADQARQVAEAAQAEAQKAADDLAKIKNKTLQDDLQSDDWDEVMEQIKLHKTKCGTNALQDGVIKTCSGVLSKINCAGKAPDASARMDANIADKVNKNNGTKVDFNELARYEGGQATSAYVPWWPNIKEIKDGAIVMADTKKEEDKINLDGANKSGVTIGTGVDLGQQDPAVYLARLKAAGASQALMDKLKPYIGLRRAAACQHLRKHPLNITKEEADLLDEEMKNDHVKNTKKEYDRLTQGIKPRREFKDLTGEEQTVLLSRHYQDGNITLREASRKLSEDIAQGNNTDALGRLTNANYGRKPKDTRIPGEHNYLKASYDAAAEAAKAKAEAEAAAAAAEGGK